MRSAPPISRSVITCTTSRVSSGAAKRIFGIRSESVALKLTTMRSTPPDFRHRVLLLNQSKELMLAPQQRGVSYCRKQSSVHLATSARKNVVLGKSVSVRVNLGDRRIIKKKKI